MGDNAAVRYAPVASFCFNRPDHAEQSWAALAQNEGADQTDLIIFIDGPRPHKEGEAEMVKLTVERAKRLTGFKSVTVLESEANKGLAASVIGGVTQVLNEHGRVIVLEDDLITSPHFLHYMNAALEQYEGRPRVMSISGFNPPPDKMPIPLDYLYDAYFNLRNSSWGWATWKDRWDKVDWEVRDYEEFCRDKAAQRAFNQGGEDMGWMLRDQMEGRINSWAIRFSYAHFKSQAFSLCPIKSYVRNVGLDGSGTHFTKATEKLGVVDLDAAVAEPRFPDEEQLDATLMAAFRQFQRRSWKWHLMRRLQHFGLLK